MTDTKPSERAMATAKAIIDNLFVTTDGLEGAETEAAAIIDEHCPERPGYDDLLAACKRVIATVRVWRHEDDSLLIAESTVKEVSAALAAAKESK
jgi:hypothetical protein